MDYNGLWSKPHVTELYYTNISRPLVCPSIRGGQTHPLQTPPGRLLAAYHFTLQMPSQREPKLLESCKSRGKLNSTWKDGTLDKVICRYFESWKVLCNFTKFHGTHIVGRYHGIFMDFPVCLFIGLEVWIWAISASCFLGRSCCLRILAGRKVVDFQV